MLADGMPDSMRELIEVVGEDAAWAIVLGWGGCRLYVRTEPGSELEQAVGIEAATRLAQRYGGDTLEIPRCWSLATRLRNEAIVRDREKLSIHALAAKYGLTRKAIYKILSKTSP